MNREISKSSILIDACVFAEVDKSDSDTNDDSRIRDDRQPGAPDDDEELPVYLWRPGQTNDVVGEWEQHTRVSYVYYLLPESNIVACYLRHTVWESKMVEAGEVMTNVLNMFLL